MTSNILKTDVLNGLAHGSTEFNNCIHKSNNNKANDIFNIGLYSSETMNGDLYQSGCILLMSNFRCLLLCILNYYYRSMDCDVQSREREYSV